MRPTAAERPFSNQHPKELVKLSRHGRRLLSLAIFSLILGAFSLGVQAQSSPGWSTVPLDFSPEVLLSRDGHQMWTAGSTETIALSTDGGRHWIKKHDNPAGGLLLTLGMVNEKFGYAAGTGSHVLLTEDGGESWNALVPVPGTVFQVAFGDVQHGVIRTRSALLATTDGGKSWKPVVPANDPTWSEKCPNTITLTALNSTHLLVRVEGDNFGEYLYSTNGGETWSAKSLPNGAGSGGAFAVGNNYWSIGMEVVGKDKPGGGLAVPMAVRSPDGNDWEHLPAYHDVCHWTGCSGCTSQGCFAGRSSFVPFSRILQSAPGNGSVKLSQNSDTKSESLAKFPPHLLSDQWAITGQRLCLLTKGTIECTNLTPVPKLDTQDDQATWETSSYPPLHETQATLHGGSIESVLPPGLHCLRCDLKRLLVSKTGSTGPVTIQLTFMVGANGRVSSAKISGGLPKDAANDLKESLSGWLFEPYLKNGTAAPTTVSLRGQVFVMNPNQPPGR